MIKQSRNRTQIRHKNITLMLYYQSQINNDHDLWNRTVSLFHLYSFIEGFFLPIRYTEIELRRNFSRNIEHYHKTSCQY